MRILVTGARGRLGALFGDWLENDGHEVVRFSRNADAKFACLSDLPQQIRQGADAVLHLAWSTVPASAEKSPGIEWREDLPLLSSIASECSSMAKRGTARPLLVFFSSCSVYGELPAGRTSAFREDDPRQPKSWYACGKKAAEELLDNFARNGLRRLTLRVSNPFGFAQSPLHLQGFIPAAAQAALQGTELAVWGDGKATKDFLDVRDLHCALTAALGRQMTGTYNVCSGESHAIENVMGVIEKVSGTTIANKRLPAAPWDVETGRYSNDLFREHAQWAPRFTLEQGIRDFMDAQIASVHSP